MKEPTKEVSYLVGNIENGEFWCATETTDRNNANLIYEELITRYPKMENVMYEKCITYKLLDLTFPNK
jgi:hypothetical protein